MGRTVVSLWGLCLFFIPWTAMAQDPGYRLEGVSVSTFNDNSPFLYSLNGGLNLGIGRGPDDQFTAGFRIDSVGAFSTPWSDKLMASSTYAIFTDAQYYAVGITGTADHAPWRQDTGSVAVQAEKYWPPFVVDYGGGILLRGNLGGQVIQDALHDRIGDVQFNIPYASGPQAGPFVTGTVKYPFLESQWLGWKWTTWGGGRGVWDVLGVLNSEGDALFQLDVESGATRLEIVVGARCSLPGNDPTLRNMYSNGLFFDDNFELSFGDFRVQFGYALNPYGAAAISQYPDYKDQNQEFHWTVIWGLDSPVPWALRFFP